jgi:alanyl-tRNA synthetase
MEDTGKIVAIMVGAESVVQANDGENAMVILDRTPFYGESGGQVGDKGIISTQNGHFEIVDTKKNADGIMIHSAKRFGT